MKKRIPRSNKVRIQQLLAENSQLKKQLVEARASAYRQLHQEGMAPVNEDLLSIVAQMRDIYQESDLDIHKGYVAMFDRAIAKAGGH